MTESILADYEHSSGPVITVIAPYARLTDTTPTEGNPCELTSRTEGTQLTGTLMTCDDTDSIAVINVAPCFVGNWEVRNVLTYSQGAEATWGAIDIGDAVYYDSSSTMPAGVYLSTSPLDEDGDNNPLFGFVVVIGSDTLLASYPLGGATASTQDCQVMQIGAGSAIA